MKSRFLKGAALVACMVALAAQTASAQNTRGNRRYQSANAAADAASATLAGFNDWSSQPGGCDLGGCDNGSCDVGCCDSGCCGCGDGSCCGCGGGGGGGWLDNSLMSRPGQFFAGAEYIYARATFSEALAFVVQDANAPLGGDNFVQFDFDRLSSYRFYGGYRLCDCGGEVVFNFARYRSDADVSLTDTATTQIFAPYEVDPIPGGRIDANASVDLKSYDIGFAKTIPLGSPLGCCDCGDCCDCGTGCGNGCGCGWCPAWDLQWSAGVRFVEADWSKNLARFDTSAISDRQATTTMDFEGTGARVGLLGRRYFGKRGTFSAYAKGDLSLLVGDITVQTTTFDQGAGQAISHRTTCNHIVPVTEIEAGATVHVRSNLQLSAGYFLAAWHDLGFRDEYDFEAPGGASRFQLSHYDDANILGFDGFFARAELAY